MPGLGILPSFRYFTAQSNGPAYSFGRYTTCRLIYLFCAMPEICRFYGIIIRMYFVDHNPPHFHAIYQGKKAEYDIRTLDVIGGKISPRAHAMVLEWASLHKDELLANWEKASIPEPLKKIKPLN